MPGISGYVNHTEPLSNPTTLLKAFEEVHTLSNITFIHRAFQSEFCVIANTMTGLIPNTLEQPATDPTGNTVLFVEGQIFNHEALQAHLSQPWGDSLGDTLLALFLERGDDFVSLVDGEFNIVIYQQRERKLIILNDYIASRPMYYMEQANSLLFGSEKKSLLAVSLDAPAIDSIGLLQLFAHRHNVAGRTLIANLHCLPPASCLMYRQEQLKLHRYAQLAFKIVKPTPKVQTLIETWGELLQQAAVKRLKDKKRVLISLSAGLDSRAVACAIPRDFRPLAARTRGYPDALEVIYATEIAKCLGFDHFREDPDVSQLSDILPKVVWRTEGAVPFTNGLSMANQAMIKQRGDFLAGGWMGNASSGSHISGFMFLPFSRRQFIEKIYGWYLLYSEKSLSHIFNPDFLGHTMSALKDAFLASFEPLEGETNIQLFELWDLYERQTRMNFGIAAVDTHLFEHVRPLADRAYLNFLTTLPAYLRYGQALYQAGIYWLGPEIRHVPNSNTDLKLKGTISGNLLNKGIAIENKAKTKLLQKIKPAYPAKFGRAALGDFTSATRNDLALRQVIENFVNASYFDPSIFNKQAILNMLERHYSGAASYADLVTLLATFVVSLDYFVYHRPHHCPPEAEPLSLVRA